jgi:hypothetical protein
MDMLNEFVDVKILAVVEGVGGLLRHLPYFCLYHKQLVIN